MVMLWTWASIASRKIYGHVDVTHVGRNPYDSRDSTTECRLEQQEASADMTQSGVITTTFEAVVQGRQVVKKFMQHSLEIKGN